MRVGMWRSPSPRLAVCLPPIFIDPKIFFFVMLFWVCVGLGLGFRVQGLAFGAWGVGLGVSRVGCGV